MTTALTASLILLVFVIIASIVALTVYLAKLMIELCLLTRNLNETTSVVKGELDPILKELTQTMKSINTIAKNADNQVASVKKIAAAAVGFVSLFLGKMNFLKGSFMKGFLSAFNLFKKK